MPRLPALLPGLLPAFYPAAGIIGPGLGSLAEGSARIRYCTRLIFSASEHTPGGLEFPGRPFGPTPCTPLSIWVPSRVPSIPGHSRYLLEIFKIFFEIEACRKLHATGAHGLNRNRTATC